jgi:hypothetical protein
MSTYEGSLRIPGDDGPPLAVVIDLTGDRFRVHDCGPLPRICAAE